MERRCVITGMGAITPVGNDIDSTWENIKKGVSGIGYITKFDTTDFKVKIAGEIKNLDYDKYVEKKDLKRNDMFSILGIAAAEQAFEMAGLEKDKIEELIAKRTEAKKAKDFAAADAIRDELAAMGITIKDTRQGVQWFRG